MAEERMPKLNLSKDALKLTVSDLHYMRIVEQVNKERVQHLKKMRLGCRILGCSLAAFAIGIYSYTIYAVKQERFLDDFDEPEKISDAE